MNVYCGQKEKPPRGKILANDPIDCKVKKQLRLYGKHRISSNSKSPLIQNPINLSTKLKPYCGTKNPPKGKRYGTQLECKKQVRRFGLLPSYQPQPINTTKEAAAKIIKRVLVKKRNLSKAEKFWETMKQVNSYAYRKVSLDRLLKNTKEFNGDKIFKGAGNKSIVKEIKILSKANTASGATAFLLKTDPYYNRTLVSKTTPVSDYTIDDINDMNIALNELDIYKIINKLVDKKICPFFIRHVPQLSGIVELNTLHQNIRNNIKYDNTHTKTVLLTMESYNSDDIKTLDKLNFDDIDIDTFIFQLTFALVCMNKINLKHNDLRSGNILMVKNNNYNTSLKKAYRTFVYGNGKDKIIYKVPYSKWDLRIFDWDRGTKGEVNAENMINIFKHSDSKSFRDLSYAWSVYDTHPNECFDYFKIMAEISNYSYDSDIILDFMYDKQRFESSDRFNKIDSDWYNDFYMLLHKKHESYITKNKPVSITPHKELKNLHPEHVLTTNDVILNKFVNPNKRIVQDENGWVNIETYHMNNIHT